VRLAGHVALMGIRGMHTGLVKKPESKRALGTFRLRQNDNIKNVS
jgi:hypothetical protein